jgi:MFS family permease
MIFISVVWTKLASAGQSRTVTAGQPETEQVPGKNEPGKAASLWRHRNFMLLWSGQTVSEMGSAVTSLALPLTAVVVLGASTLQVGLLTTAAYSAFALIALPAGAIVDRLVKLRIMIWCDAARLLLIGSVPVAAALGVLTLWQLYVVAVLAGVCTVFFDVSYQSILPGLVGPEHLMDGNGKFGASQSFAQVCGPGLGGGLVGAFGAAGAMGADAVSYGFSVASLLAIRSPRQRPVRTSDRRLRAEIAEGLSFVVRHPILRKITACTATANVFGGMVSALEILFLVRVLRVRPADTGLVLAVASLGGVAGGVLSGRMSRWIGSARVIWVAMLVLDLPSFLIPLAEPGWRVAVFAAGFAGYSFSGVVYNVAQLSYRQAICPPALLGRMNAAVRWIVWGTLPFGGVLGGLAGDAIGIRPTLWIGVSGVWLAGLLVYFSPLRKLRDIPAQLPGGNSEDHGAPRGGIPGHRGGKAAHRTRPQFGDQPRLAKRSQPDAAQVGGAELGDIKRHVRGTGSGLAGSRQTIRGQVITWISPKPPEPGIRPELAVAHLDDQVYGAGIPASGERARDVDQPHPDPVGQLRPCPPRIGEQGEERVVHGPELSMETGRQVPAQQVGPEGGAGVRVGGDELADLQLAVRQGRILLPSPEPGIEGVAARAAVVFCEEAAQRTCPVPPVLGIGDPPLPPVLVPREEARPGSHHVVVHLGKLRPGVGRLDQPQPQAAR